MLRPVLTLLPLALAALAPVQQVTFVVAPDAEARWVAFELTPSNQIRFALTIGGRPAHAILDTGLSDTIVTRAFADAAGLKASGSEQALAIGGGVDVAWTRGATLAFGGLTRKGGRIGITDVPGQERFGADAFIGSDTLGCCALDIDYAARRFRILPTGRLPFAGTIAPLARSPGSGVPTSEVRVAGKRLRPIIVDTGDGSSLTLTRAAWLAVGYKGPVTTTLGWGMGGGVVTDTAVVKTLVLPGRPAAESEVRVEGEDGFSARAGAAGRVGNGLLARYRVLLDPRAGRMVLSPAAMAPPVQRSTSGLLLGYSNGALEVLHVMRGSPAAEAGFRDRDRICAADGAPVEKAPASWTAGAPGRTVRLTMCDGSERSLTLRLFY